MALKVIVFDELLRRQPELFLTLEELGAAVTPVDSGQDVLRLVDSTSPSAVILDAFMPKMSGVEICRQLNLREQGVRPAVVLFGPTLSATMVDRVMESGCTLLVRGAGEVGELRQLLVSRQTATPSSGTPLSSEPSQTEVAPQSNLAERRHEPRIDLTGEVSIHWNGQDLRGILMNASRSGVLFACGKNIPKDSSVRLVFEGIDSSILEFETTVVRAARLKEAHQGHAFAIGSKLLNVTEADQEKLDALLGFHGGATGIEAGTVEKVLDMPVEVFTAILTGSEDPMGIRPYTGQLTGFEELSLTQEGQIYECVRRGLCLRTQASIFSTFVPSIELNRATFGPIFLPRARDLLASIDQFENDTDSIVRKLVSEEADDVRRSFNETNNRLHEAKKRLLFSLADRISPNNLPGPEKELVEAFKARSSEFRSASDVPSAATQKYDRKAKPVQTEPEEEKDEVRAAKTKQWIKVGTTAGVMIGLVLAFLGYKYFSTRVSSTKLSLPAQVTEMVITEDGLDVYTTYASWHNLTDEQRKELFNKIIEYLRPKFRRQAIIMDEKKVRLAVITSGRDGRDIFYEARVIKQ